MRRLAVAALAAGHKMESPVSGQFLLGQFVGVFLIAAIIAFFSAKAKNDRGPLGFAITWGVVAAGLSIVFTLIMGNALQ